MELSVFTTHQHANGHTKHRLFTARQTLSLSLEESCRTRGYVYGTVCSLC